MQLLMAAFNNGMIDLEAIGSAMKERERKDIINGHALKIYYSGNYYCTYVKERDGSRKKLRGKTRKQLEDRLCDFYLKTQRKTIEDIFFEWADAKLNYKEISKATYDRYLADYKRYLEVVGATDISKVDEHFLEDLVRKTIRDQNLTSKSFSNFRTILYGMLKYARRQGLIDYDVTVVFSAMDISRKIFRPVRRKSEEQIFLPEEKEILEAYLEEHESIHHLGLLLLFKTGLRVGELVALKRSDINNYTLHICKSETRFIDENGTARFEICNHPKTEAGIRNVVVPTKYHWIIDRILELNPDGEYLFEFNGNRIKTYSFRKQLRMSCRACGLPEKSPHKIRKTYGTILLDSNVKESTIIQTMGHTDINCTRGYYYFDQGSDSTKRMELDAIEIL